MPFTVFSHSVAETFIILPYPCVKKAAGAAGRRYANERPTGPWPATPNQNRRNFFLYAAIALLIMMLLNAFVMPMLHGANITEVDYGTFLRMVDGEVEGVTVDTVQIDENGQEIIFSAKDSTGQVSYYSTGAFPDAELVDRLSANEDIKFTK